VTTGYRCAPEEDGDRLRSYTLPYERTHAQEATMSAHGLQVDSSTQGLEVGTPDLRSVGPMTFGPGGILFLADNVSAAIFAVDVGDVGLATDTSPIEVDNLDTRLAAYLGCPRDEVSIRDMAVHPLSGSVYLSVMRGSGSTAQPLVAKLGAEGALAELPLENVAYSKKAIEDAPSEDDDRLDGRVVQDGEDGEELDIHGVQLRVARDKLRTVTVTDMAYVDGVLLVAGASNEEFSSSLRRIPFPFNGEAQTSSLEIYHVSHGKYETASPLRTFVPFGSASVLASYTCTPIVHFSLADLQSGSQAKGRTVAELGAMNTPIDMVSYVSGGDEYLLVSNARHPLFKIACSDIDGQDALTEPREPVGVPREALPHEGVTRMANLNGSHVLMMQRDEGGIHLRSYSCASL
jgi:hypothetical protein